MFSSPALSPALGDSPAWYSGITIAFALTLTVVVGLWTHGGVCAPADPAGALIKLATAAVALALPAAGAWRWLDRMLWNPIDPAHADMLVVIRQGIHRFLRGRDPYAVYHVPWDAPLPYGPVRWGPYVIPSVLRADLRFVTIVAGVIATLWIAGANALKLECATSATLVEAGLGDDPHHVALGGPSPRGAPGEVK